MPSPRWWRIGVLRLRSLFRGSALDRELDEELRDHIDRQTEANLARGMAPEQARRSALLAMGGVEARKEDVRDARRVRVWLDLVQDLRYGARLLARSPGVTVIAVLSLGLGIGANTAMFTALDALMLTRLPVHDPAALKQLVTIDNPPSRSDSINFRRFEPLHEAGTMFSSMAAIWSIDRSNLTVEPRPGDAGTADADAGQVRVGLATSDYFSTIGVRPIIGRTFAAEEDRVPGGHALAVVTYGFWQRRLGGDADAVGRTLRLNGMAYEVIGVTPRGFTGEWVGMPTDLWVPFTMASQVMPEVPGGPDLFPCRIFARLSPGVPAEQARAAMEAVYRRLLNDDSGGTGMTPFGSPVQRVQVELDNADRGYSPQRQRFSQSLIILAAGVGLLMLIACANLTNLLLARAAARRREMAVRLAVGAGRGRLIRQMLTESLLIAAAGGVAGVLIAIWATRALGVMLAAAPVSLGGQGTGLVLDLTLGGREYVYAAVLTLFAGLLFGGGPALSTRTIPLAPALGGGTRVVGRSGLEGPRSALLVAQVALSLVLLIGAGLFLRTLQNLRTHELGIERQRELLIWTVPGQTGRQDAAMAAYWRTVQERLSTLPGVVAVGATNQGVLNGSIFMPSGRPGVGMTVDGEPPKPTNRNGVRIFTTPGFFDALGVPLIAGRDFTERDTEALPPVVIINEAMARFYFGDGPAVGRHVRFGSRDKEPTEVVGVVRDYVRDNPRSAGHEFNTYFSYRHREALNRGAQTRLRIMMVAVRTAGNPLPLVETVRQQLRAIDPLVPILRINTTDQQLDDVLAQERLVAALSMSLGVLAVVLACLGLFGLVSYRVARRTNEIGVRLAVGATPAGMLTLILGESLRLVATGLVVGMLVAMAVARLVSSRLYGVTATDPWTMAGAGALLMAVATVAAFLPARRASTVDPTVALRCD